jgi:hypothetical protein
MSSGEDQSLQDARQSAAPKALTPDRRFFFDGDQWHAVPLAPEVVITRRRRMPPIVMWLLVVIASIAGAGIIFEALVAIGLLATHQVAN